MKRPHQSVVCLESFEARQFLSAAPVNLRPSIGGLTDSPDPVTKGANVTLVASGVSDPEGAVAKVEFYRDINGNGIFEKSIDPQIGLDGSPRRGWNFVYNTTPCPSGWNTFFARTRDNLGQVSKPAVTKCFVVGKINYVGHYRGPITFTKGGSGVNTIDLYINSQASGILTGNLQQPGMTIGFKATLGKNYNYSVVLSGPVTGSGTGTYNPVTATINCTFTAKSLDDGSIHSGYFSVKKIA